MLHQLINHKTDKQMKTFLPALILLMLTHTLAAQFGGGEGTEANPYRIATAQHLTELSNDVNGGTLYGNKYFVLTNDIDFTNYDGNGNNYFGTGSPGYNNGEGWIPIGNTVRRFWGKLDGRNHTIKGLYINRNSDYQGLFGAIESSVKNLILLNVDIRGGSFCAGISPRVYQNGSVTNCHVTGSVKGVSTVGGIAGAVSTNAIISRTSFKGRIEGTGTMGGISGSMSEDGLIEWCRTNVEIIGSGDYIGGIIGNSYRGLIKTSYSSGSISTSEKSAGGVAGLIQGGIIENCYSLASVSAGNNAGGLVGSNVGIVRGCYSAGAVGQAVSRGGLVGSNTGTVSNSFWDINTSGITTGAGTGLTTSEMKERQPFIDAGWDFNNMWTSHEMICNGYHHFMPVTPEKPTGQGTAALPYKIESLANLFWINHNMIYGKNYIQTADIDATETSAWHFGDGWVPLGSPSRPFTGSYNGNWYMISNIHINFPEIDGLGFFAELSNATIQKLGLKNITIRGRNNLGALASVSKNSNISFCFTSGNIFGNNYIGGFFNTTLLANKINSCYSRVNLTANSSIGGLVSAALDNSTIGESYYAGVIKGNSSLGGLISYADDPYSAGDCIWDMQLSGVTVSSSGTGYNTSAMKNIDTYMSLGWDGDTWLIDEHNDSYPRFSSGSTFIFNQNDAETASVYPNPASSSLKINGRQIITRIEIYNNAGICTLALTNLQVEEALVDISGLKTGMYIVKVYYSDILSSVHKIIINNN